MPEQFGIYGSFGYRSAVYGNIFSMLSGTVGMYNLWKELFSRTAFSGNKHSQIDRCDL
mgnify:CR=1 FL=1